MELDQVENVQKIAKKINCKNKDKRLAIAQEVNELAKIIIDIYQAEKRNASHESNSLH